MCSDPHSPSSLTRDAAGILDQALPRRQEASLKKRPGPGWTPRQSRNGGIARSIGRLRQRCSDVATCMAAWALGRWGCRRVLRPVHYASWCLEIRIVLRAAIQELARSKWPTPCRTPQGTPPASSANRLWSSRAVQSTSRHTAEARRSRPASTPKCTPAKPAIQARLWRRNPERCRAPRAILLRRVEAGPPPHPRAHQRT